MTQRIHARSRVIEDGRPFSTSIITCHKCGETATFVHRNNTKRMAPDGVTQWFRNHGWLVGHRPNGDQCPTCITAGKRRHLKLVPQEEEMQPVNKSPLKATTMLTPMTLQASADPPRIMTRDDRRIINDKLDGIYADGSYSFPWTDAKVARDLGVPQAWVAEVRDAFFGPAGSNPEIEAFLDKLEPMMVAAKGYVTQAAKQARDNEDRITAAQALVRAVGDLTARIGELEQLAAKLRKETGK